MTRKKDERTVDNTLVIDDFRTLRFPATTIRNWQDAEVALYSQPWREVWLDYDLDFGLDRNEHKLRDGKPYNIRPLIDLIVEDAVRGTLLPVERFVIHSSNNWGREYMFAQLSPFYPIKMVEAIDWTERHEFPDWANYLRPLWQPNN